MGHPTPQYYRREWKGRNLFVRALLVYIFNSLILGREAESDFQCFDDERPDALVFGGLPMAPIWIELSQYLFYLSSLIRLFVTHRRMDSTSSLMPR